LKCSDNVFTRPTTQGLTLYHFSARREHFLLERQVVARFW
jgi:hypothetical protein